MAVYSEADENSLHVRFADEDVCIGPARSADSYLNVPAVISAAEITGADAIHPGYGFLSESAYLAEVCEACHIKFIGPDPQVIRLMGDKARARRAMKKAGVPILPGSDGPVESEEKALKVAKDIGYPVIIKATAGGGGRGMRVVRAPGELSHAVKTAQREAEAAFGVGDVYIEKYVESPRHIEFQILGDHHGNVVHLGERECSIQRRHQKLIEESPSPALSEKMRRKMGGIVIDAAKAVQYTNAGTFEFLMDPDGHFYFMEANTRLQVEHPVTEMVTGIDIVKEQIRIAAGERLSFKQSEVTFTGPRDRVPHQRRGSRDVRALAGRDPRLQRAGRPRRARRDVRALRVHDLAVLRLDDRQDHRARPRPPGSDRAHAAHARDDGHRRHQDHHPAAPADPRRPRFRRRQAEHVVHGALPRRARAAAASPRRSDVESPVHESEPQSATLSPALRRSSTPTLAGRAGWTLADLARGVPRRRRTLAPAPREDDVRRRAPRDWPTAIVSRRAPPRARSSIVNDRADIARLAGADGVHVGQDDLSPAAVRAIVGADAIVGLSTHTPAQIDAAVARAGDLRRRSGRCSARRRRTTGYDGRRPRAGPYTAARARARPRGGLPARRHRRHHARPRRRRHPAPAPASVAVIGDLLQHRRSATRGSRAYLDRLGATASAIAV